MIYTTVGKNFNDSMNDCVALGAAANRWTAKLLTNLDQTTREFISAAFDQPFDGALDGQFNPAAVLKVGLFIGE